LKPDEERDKIDGDRKKEKSVTYLNRTIAFRQKETHHVNKTDTGLSSELVTSSITLLSWSIFVAMIGFVRFMAVP
jgi:hypothetical protein